MHSYQLFYDDFFVPDENVVGESQGLGRGFYFTMRGLMGGRIQTAARACGVMQAAFDQAVRYSQERKVFGQPIADFELTQSKIARMAAYLSAARQMTYAVGRLMDQGKGQRETVTIGHDRTPDQVGTHTPEKGRWNHIEMVNGVVRPGISAAFDEVLGSYEAS